MTTDPHGSQGPTPLTQLMVSMTGAGGSEEGHGTVPPGADPVSLRAGHEPDRFNVRGILYVPLFVVAVVGVAYVVVISVFSGFVHKADIKDAKNPQAVPLSQAPINERLARTSSTDPKALKDVPGSAVPQPRLEFLKETENDGPAGPPNVRSKRPTREGNSPEYRPEDLRPDNFVDPSLHAKVLAEYGWVDPAKHTARVPIDVAIKAVATPGKLPTKKGADGKPVPGPVATSDAKAKPSNAGRGSSVPFETPAPAPTKATKGPEKH